MTTTPVVLNFSHPLTAAHLADLQARLGAPVEERRFTVQVPAQMSLAQAAWNLVDQVGLDGTAWQGRPILIVVPGLAPLAACLLAELHGRCGYFPACVVIRPDPKGMPGTFVVAEVLDLQGVRYRSREQREGAGLS